MIALLRKHSFFRLMSLLLFLSACTSKKESPQPTLPAVSVEAAEVISKDVPSFITSIGNIGASLVVEIRTQVDGELLLIHVKEGEKVEKGQLLFSIDPQPYLDELHRGEGALKKDEALLQFANQKLERYKELLKGEYVSKLNYEEYLRDAAVNESQILIDQADLNLAKFHLSHTEIKAPISGLLSKFSFDPGNLIKTTSTDPLTIIRQISPATVSFSIPQQYFSEVKKHQYQGQLKFFIRVNSQEGFDESNSGFVSFIDNNINPTTGSILLKGSVPNLNDSLWPGEIVVVRLQLKVYPQALVVPESAVQRSQDGYFLYVIKEDMTVKNIPIAILEEMERETAISGNLKVGDKVVTEGQLNLIEGSLVSIKKADPVKQSEDAPAPLVKEVEPL